MAHTAPNSWKMSKVVEAGALHVIINHPKFDKIDVTDLLSLLCILFPALEKWFSI